MSRSGGLFDLGFLGTLFHPWTWVMAWRDSRRSRRRLLLYASSIVLGIAGLTAISSSGEAMKRAIQEQSKTLLGADLVLSARDAFSSEAEKLLASIGGEQAREIAFPSMIYFPKNQGARLVQIRALAGNFPFYGEMETVPENAVASLRAGGGVLIEDHLAKLFEAKVGDEVKVGDSTFPIVGILAKVPGETVGFGTLAPRVYVPLASIEKAKLLSEGSLARYKVYVKLPPEVNPEQLVSDLRPELRRLGLMSDTVEERQRDLGRALEHMLRFLNLISLGALLLGGIGVASGIHVHTKEKIGVIATLRCLGCSVRQAFAVYFGQAMVLGLVGALVGAALGLAVHFLIPLLFADILPVPISFIVAWKPVASGIGVGFLVCLLFALLPLLPIRKISPLGALRSAVSHEHLARRDPLVWLAYALIGAGLVAFSIAQTRELDQGLAYAGVVAGGFLLLSGAAWTVAALSRRLVSPSWPFILRHGFSNLYRPNNRTLLLMVSLGMGTFLVVTLYLMHMNLLRELLRPGRQTQGNAILFDIQADQHEAVLDLLRTQKLPILETVPMISMRLQSIKGRTVEEIRKDPRSGIRNWVLSREYRCTYRSKLSDTEKLIAGRLHPRVENTEDPIPVSLEEGIARNLNVRLGDDIVFDIQGVPVTARVASLREVDWRRLSPNFFVVFPLGAIEDAPATHMVLTHVETGEQSARLQREVARQFANVSAVDLTLVLETIDTVLSKISFVIRFMALFSVGAGLLVLAGAIASSRYQRLQESILLRTLGATRRQVLQMLTVEYLLLGGLGAMTGILLALAASWGLSKFVFKIGFGFYPLPMLIALVAAAALTTAAGLFGNRTILTYPPLEVLRKEG